MEAARRGACIRPISLRDLHSSFDLEVLSGDAIRASRRP